MNYIECTVHANHCDLLDNDKNNHHHEKDIKLFYL